MDTSSRNRILVADNNPLFRETLARYLRAAGYDVTTSDTGEEAFRLLRDWQHPIGWLYTRAGLPFLVDGWILADEYHGTYSMRPAVIAGAEARPSPYGDIILGQPNPVAVLEIIRQLIDTSHDLPAARSGHDRLRVAA